MEDCTEPWKEECKLSCNFFYKYLYLLYLHYLCIFSVITLNLSPKAFQSILISDHLPIVTTEH